MILNMSAGEHKHDDARASRCESFCAFDPSWAWPRSHSVGAPRM